ncbi:MAG: glutamate-1-semialdehyde 2,1-aminomutase [candidate division Zixibacteria bacterium]|nr:glutamate-1-semialdehyde 2,1-aminomutase [candidate division Zixibacteria bacterium]MDH3937490.1 glutamate-1-semialdehyde 2,1-aminomutase [candidate division Zixibacteria bacterium]
MNGGNPNTDKSQRLLKLAEEVTPGGVHSPVRAFGAVGGCPRFIERGEGPYLFDVDGNKYLDFCCSWGPLILGHADSDVVAAVKEQVDRGMTFGASTELEYKLAQFIVSRIEVVDKIRFVSSGTEAVMSAIRLARGFTKRDLILKFEGCYHGHSDHLLVKAGSGLVTFGQTASAGVPDDITKNTVVLPLDDEEALQKFFAEYGDKLAAVIIEGVPANNGLLIQRHDYMRLLRTLTEQHGVVLILDEVITGFRIGFGGATEYYGIRPDLVTYGKIIGGGMPVGAFGGRADIMDHVAPLGAVYQAGTLSGNPVAMTAGLATLEKLAADNIYAEMENRNRRFVSEITTRLASSSVNIAGVASIFWILFQRDIPRSAAAIDSDGIAHYNRMHTRMLNAGIYLPPSGYEVCFLSTVHTDEVLNEAAETIARIIGEEAHQWA